jgi:hypothetical protein
LEAVFLYDEYMKTIFEKDTKNAEILLLSLIVGLIAMNMAAVSGLLG